MKAYDSVHLGKHIAKIVDVEISNNVRFGKYIADVFKPVYRVNGNTIKDNGIFKYKHVQGFSHDPKKNWGYAKFLNVMGVRKSNTTNENFKFENFIGKLVEIEVYEKIFNNTFSKRVKYPVARVVRYVEVPF
tara:strand:+ start:302 stop:697 length:396 start_codon:yes stop_codon:yes gene_type:complete